MKNRYQLIIAYDGTNYSGWQVQPQAITIQGLITKAIATITREKVVIIGAGRTDAGVHALEQVAHFELERKIIPSRFLVSLNGLLPRDIRINQVKHMPNTFHAQRSTKSKIYHYHLYLNKVACPFRSRYRWHIHEKLDLMLLQKAAKKFIGTHDFTSFANEAQSGSASRNPVRKLTRLDVVSEDGGIRLEFEANGFLYRMVRNITGMLVDIARGKYPLEKIEETFAAKDRRKASRAAPPQGLFLVTVDYGEVDQMKQSEEPLPF